AAGAGPGRGLPSVWARWRGRLRVARSGSALRGIPLAARHLVLGLMPSAETAAVSASRATGGEQQARRRDPAGAWEYGWPIRLMCVVTALAYFVTGMAKVTGELGWSWVSGEALRSQVAADALRKEVLGDAGSPPGSCRSTLPTGGHETGPAHRMATRPRAVDLPGPARRGKPPRRSGGAQVSSLTGPSRELTRDSSRPAAGAEPRVHSRTS